MPAHGVTRSVALRCVLVACAALAAERATAAQGGTHDAAQSRRGVEVAGGSPAAESVQTLVADATPLVVVTPDAAAYVLVGAGAVKIGAHVAWIVAYLATVDRGDAAAPTDAERLRVADALFRAQQVAAEAAGADLVSVVAVSGPPGQPGVSEELTYVRERDGWNRPARPLRGQVPSVPAVGPVAERDPAVEASAVEVAERFLACIDASDFDAAWDLASAVVKATMSRTSFERQLRPLRPPAGGEPRREAFHGFPLGPFIPGAYLEVLFVGPRVLEAIRLRMDDDMEWRVAALRTFARTPATSSSTAEGPPATTRTAGPTAVPGP